jgi:transposase-like protein
MDARVKRFREAVARSGVGGVGRRYPMELRAVAVAVAEDRREEPLSRVAADLGISAVSLQRWLEQSEPIRFRPVEVEVASAEVPETPARGLALITPRGYRVEGLEAAELVSLLRVLG